MTDTTNPNREQAREVLARYPRSRAAGIRSEESIIAAMLEFAALPPPEAERVEIPAAMKPWAGGDSAPADWNPDEPVLLGNGNRLILSQKLPDRWGRPVCFPGSWIIAYTPRPTNDPADSAGESGELRDKAQYLIDRRWAEASPEWGIPDWIETDAPRRFAEQVLAALHPTQDSCDVAGAEAMGIAQRECEAVWRCAVGDVTSALDVLKNKWVGSKRKAEREAGATLSGVLDLVWAYRDPAAGSYAQANANGKVLTNRIRAALDLDTTGGEAR